MIKLKILIVDDEIDYCMILKNYFEKNNFEVSLAFTLHDGLKAINELKPDYLFLDNNLPDGKAWSHLNDIVEKNPHMRIYLVSAHHHKEDFVTDLSNVQVWEKPVSLGTLRENFFNAGSNGTN